MLIPCFVRRFVLKNQPDFLFSEFIIFSFSRFRHSFLALTISVFFYLHSKIKLIFRKCSFFLVFSNSSHRVIKAFFTFFFADSNFPIQFQLVLVKHYFWVKVRGGKYNFPICSNLCFSKALFFSSFFQFQCIFKLSFFGILVLILKSTFFYSWFLIDRYLCPDSFFFFRYKNRNHPSL